MKSCRSASVVATVALLALGASASCRDALRPEVPPVTMARPAEPAAPGEPGETGATVQAPSAAGPGDAAACPVEARFVDTPATLEAAPCRRALVAVVKGTLTALDETLTAGDVLVVTHGTPFAATGAGTVVWAEVALGGECEALSRPAPTKVVVRATAAPPLRWAAGAMTAHLDLATSVAKVDGVKNARPAAPVSPELYLGRLEGTPGVPEHRHAASWEILAAVEADGTFVLEGREAHLGPRQIVMVPPGTRHAWRPEPGSKLVAVQMYWPPGPEQRFVGLAAADKDAGAARHAVDAGPVR